MWRQLLNLLGWSAQGSDDDDEDTDPGDASKTAGTRREEPDPNQRME